MIDFEKHYKGFLPTGTAIILLIILVFTTHLGVDDYKEYMYYKDKVIPITATVSKIEEDTGEDENDYEIYVSYTYNGESVSNKYFKDTPKRNDYLIGSSITVYIDPENPSYIFKNNKGTFFLGTAIVALAFAVWSITEKLRVIKDNPYQEQNMITDVYVADNLKPRFCIAISKIPIFCGVGLILCHRVIPLIYSEIWGYVSLFIGLIFLGITICIMYNLPNKKYTLGTHRCTEQWSEGSGDDTTHHTMFRSDNGGTKIKINGYYGIIGKKYYTVVNQHGKLCAIYDMEKWQPAVEDKTLVTGSRTVIKHLIFEVITGIILVGIYATIMWAVINAI